MPVGSQAACAPICEGQVHGAPGSELRVTSRDEAGPLRGREAAHICCLFINLSRPPIKYPSTSSLPGKWPSSYTVRKPERNKPVSHDTKNALGIATASSVQSSYTEKFYIAAVSVLFSVQLERVPLWLIMSREPLRTGSQHLHSLTQPSRDFPTGFFASPLTQG